MEEKIRLRIGTVLNDNRIDILSEDGDSLLHDLCRVIEQELDKAREEGYEKGLEDSYEDYDGRLNDPEISKKLKELDKLSNKRE